jgi:hypothetical protein
MKCAVCGHDPEEVTRIRNQFRITYGIITEAIREFARFLNASTADPDR